MNPTLSGIGPLAVPFRATLSFQVSRSHDLPLYYQLSLIDTGSEVAHWIIPLSLKHVAKRALLVWQMQPGLLAPGLLAPVDAGVLGLAPCQAGTTPTLRAGLARGVLRLHFQGRLLQGYFRLQCLPQGGGQLWQLIPIGHV